MRVSIIIPTFNGAQRISQLIPELLSWQQDFNIVVVIDGSEDKTAGIINDFKDNRLLVINQKNRGRAGARNSGAEFAKNEILWFLDDDMTPVQGNLKKIDEHFMEVSGSILVGAQNEKSIDCHSDVQRYKSFISEKWQNSFGEQKTKLTAPYITAANMVIEKKLFKVLGGFDDQLTDTEDFDLAIRAVNKNVPIYFDPSLIGWHLPIASAAEHVKRQIQYVKSERNLYKLKPGMGKYPAYKPGPLRRIVFSIFFSDWWILQIDRESFSWIPKNLRYKLYDIIFTAHSKLKT